MLKKLFVSLLIGVFLLTGTNGFTQFLDYKEYNEEIFMIIGEITTLSVYYPTRVSVRNPEIIDIDPVSEKELVIVAKQSGSTALTIWDKEGQKVYYVTVYAHDPDTLQKRLNKLIKIDLGIKGVRFKKNETNGKLMVVGSVTEEEKAQIEKVIAPFAESIDVLLGIKEESKMVEVECQILELTKSYADILGFDWAGTAGSNPTSVTTLTESLTGKAASTGGSLKDVFRIVDWTRTAMDVKLNAAVNEGKGKILARPKLLCLSGKEASFLVGGEIPVVKVTATSAGDTVAEDVEYKEYGIRLNIQPFAIGEDGVKLALTTEVKELSSEGQYVRADGTVIKAFTTRNASTVLRLNDGQGIIISGLLKDKVTKDDISKVPGLGDMPILGALFRSKDYQDDQTELVISLIPKIIDSEKKETNMPPLKEKEASVSKTTIYPEYLNKEAVLNDYILDVQRRIFSSLNYPDLAKEAGWQGAVKIRIHLDYTGEVLDIRITDSSGYLSFDNSVVETAKSLSPYPPLPSSVDIEDLWIDIPIVYRLD